MALLNSKNLSRAALVWLAIFTTYEMFDSFQWMVNTESMFTAHPALGKWAGYEATMQGEGALQRLPIVTGKWIGMAKFFLVGALLTVLIFGNNRARAFILFWNFICLMIMSLALYPTLDAITSQHPEDFSNSFSVMWGLETLVGVLSGLFFLCAVVSDFKHNRESKTPHASAS